MSQSQSQYEDKPNQSFIDVIVSMKALVGAETSSAKISVGTLVDRLDERAFGLMILLFTIPCLVPGLPGAQLIAIPIFLLGCQMAMGRSELWLPKRALDAEIKGNWLENIANFVDQRLRWTQRLSRPRLTFLATGLAERVIGAVIALAAITIMLPITNTIPSLAITIVAVGLLQRDGLFTLLGGGLALAWLSFLVIMIWGVFAGAGFAMEFLTQHVPWLAQRLGR